MCAHALVPPDLDDDLRRRARTAAGIAIGREMLGALFQNLHEMLETAAENRAITAAITRCVDRAGLEVNYWRASSAQRPGMRAAWWDWTDLGATPTLRPIGRALRQLDALAAAVFELTVPEDRRLLEKLRTALYAGDTEAARTLIEAGAQLDWRGVPPRPSVSTIRFESREEPLEEGCAPLTLACRAGLTELVELMLETTPERRAAALAGASDRGGRIGTPIHSAANARVVEVLLRRGPPRTFAEWEVAGQLSVDHTNGEGGRAG